MKNTRKPKHLFGPSGELDWKMREEGYTDIKDFIKNSGIKLSSDPIYRAIGKNSGPKISAPSLILITKYLGYNPDEISDILKRAGDKDLYPLIGNSKNFMNDQETALIELFRKIKNRSGAVDQVILFARSEGLTDKDMPTGLRGTSVKVVTGQFGNGQ